MTKAASTISALKGRQKLYSSDPEAARKYALSTVSGRARRSRAPITLSRVSIQHQELPDDDTPRSDD